MPFQSPSPYTDLSTKMEPCYQILDIAAREIKRAMDTGGFYRTPAVLAAVRQIEGDLRKVISAYAEAQAQQKTFEAPIAEATQGAGEGDEYADAPGGDTAEE
jgi:hypothetical protein